MTQKSSNSKNRVLVLLQDLESLKDAPIQIPEWKVLLKIDGEKSAGEIATIVKMSDTEFNRVLLKLKKLKLVQEVDTSDGQPSPGADAGETGTSASTAEKNEPPVTEKKAKSKKSKNLTLDNLFELNEEEQLLSDTLRILESQEADQETDTVTDDAPEKEELPPSPEAEQRQSMSDTPAEVTTPEEPHALETGSEVIASADVAPEKPADTRQPAKSATITLPTDAIVLRAENLVKIYGKRRVVNDVSLQLAQGQIVGLLGPNGAGKTTSFYMITGLIAPNSGRIYLNEKEITKLPMYKRARRGLAYLPQEASIFRKLSVEENLLAIMEALRFPKKLRKERCEQLMEELRITHIAKSKGYNLSGGERRRTEIARALVNNPRFILLDEPFAGVDPIAVQDIQNIVVSLKAKNIGILITDHNVHETLSITDHAYLLFEGKVLKEGNSEFLANDPEARKLYLGESFRLNR